jgi:DHA2 family multidrug resistance protein
MVVALVALVTFVVHEFETPNPVVDFRVFAHRSYAAATAINRLTGMVLFSGSFLFSLYCGVVMRYSALDIGLAFLKGSAIQIVIIPLIGRYGAKLDLRPGAHPRHGRDVIEPMDQRAPDESFGQR